MKKIILTAGIACGLMLGTAGTASATGNDNPGIPKVDICHNGQTINIAWPAAVVHLALHQGDTEGPCPEVEPTPEPTPKVTATPEPTASPTPEPTEEPEVCVPRDAGRPDNGGEDQHGRWVGEDRFADELICTGGGGNSTPTPEPTVFLPEPSGVATPDRGPSVVACWYGPFYRDGVDISRADEGIGIPVFAFADDLTAHKDDGLLWIGLCPFVSNVNPVPVPAVVEPAVSYPLPAHAGHGVFSESAEARQTARERTAIFAGALILTYGVGYGVYTLRKRGA